MKKTLTITLHGLPSFNKDVDGEVFARKFFKFMQGLGEADAAANGSRRLKFLIERLEKNTATAAVREQIGEGPAEWESGIGFYERAAEAIYQDDPSARLLPIDLVKYLLELPKGLGTTFERGEIKGDNDNYIAIDERLERNARRVLADIERLNLGRVEPFAGNARISLDGTVKALMASEDGDGVVVELTAGGKQIECDVSAINESVLREVWKKRCTVSGLASYGADSLLPVTIEAVSIVPVGEGGDWRSWRGALTRHPENLDDWH